MKLDMSVLDRPAGKLHEELDLPRLEGTDLDAGSFALPSVQDVSSLCFEEGAKVFALGGSRGYISAPIIEKARELSSCARPRHRACSLRRSRRDHHPACMRASLCAPSPTLI